MTDFSDDFFIEPEDLLNCLATPDAPLLYDVRRKAVFQEAERMLPAARWRDHSRVRDWAGEIPPDRQVIVYCVHGEQVGQSAASVLRGLGLRAQALRPGIDGWVDAGGPTVLRSALAPEQAGEDERTSRWLMSLDATPGDLAAAWLVRRFIDRQAEMHFAERSQATAAAAELEACVIGSPSDYGNVAVDAEALLVRYGLEDAALSRLVAMTDDIDGSHAGNRPQSGGLELMISGLKRLAGDEQEVLRRSCALFDALYAGLSAAEAEPAQ